METLEAFLNSESLTDQQKLWVQEIKDRRMVPYIMSLLCLNKRDEARNVLVNWNPGKNYKKYYLMTALENGHFSMLNAFPETHDSLVREGKPFRMGLPVSSCLSLALRGYPRTAYALYRAITGIIRFKKKILR